MRKNWRIELFDSRLYKRGNQSSCETTYVGAGHISFDLRIPLFPWNDDYIIDNACMNELKSMKKERSYIAITQKLKKLLNMGLENKADFNRIRNSWS